MSQWKHFSPETDPVLFTCQETGEQGIDEAFVDELDKLREICGFPFVVNSGYRSAKHSREALKDKPGTHNKGIAADIKITNGSRRYVIVKRAIAMGFTGIGIAETFVHVDTRKSTPVIWIY